MENATTLSGMKNFHFILTVFILSLFLPLQVFSQSSENTDSTPEPYAENEFPQWSKDLRRFEIVSLGAVPFVAISVNLGYSAYQYFSGNSSTFETPFTKGTSFTEGEQMKIFCASIGAGVIIGFSDLAINLVKRHNEKKRQQKILESHDQIIVVPFQESENTKNENLNSEQ